MRNYAGEIYVYPQTKPKAKRRPRPASQPPCFAVDPPAGA